MSGVVGPARNIFFFFFPFLIDLAQTGRTWPLSRFSVPMATNYLQQMANSFWQSRDYNSRGGRNRETCRYLWVGVFRGPGGSYHVGRSVFFFLSRNPRPTSHDCNSKHFNSPLLLVKFIWWLNHFSTFFFCFFSFRWFGQPRCSTPFRCLFTF